MVKITVKTVNVELYVEERDFILKLMQYILLDDLRDKLINATPMADNLLVVVSLDSFDLEYLIGNLSLEANHNDSQCIQDSAFEVSERLEMYEALVR